MSSTPQPTAPRRLLQWFGLSQPENPSDDDLMRRRVILLAWPAIIEGLLQTSIQVVDTFLVSRVSDAALAGVGAAIQLVFVMILAFTAVAVGCSVLVAQAVGAKDFGRASAIAKQSLILGVIISIPLLILALSLADQLIGLYGMPADVTAIGVDYWRVNAFALLPFVGMFVLGGVLRGTGDTKTPMLSTLAANIVNTIVAYGLIFGRLGFPEIGVVGSAWGTVVGRSAAVLVLLFVLLRPDQLVNLRGWSDWRPKLETARNVLRIGVPSAIENVTTAIGFTTMTAVVAILGTAALAAHRITFNALSLSFMPALGMSMAATALVGQAVGARDPASARRAATISSHYAALWMGMIGVIYLLTGDQIMGLFSSDPAVIGIGGDSLRVLAFSQPFWGLMLVYSGAMRGTGNSRYPMLVNSIMIWITVGLSYIAIGQLGLSLPYAWGTFLIVSPISILLLRRKLLSDPLLSEQEEEGTGETVPADRRPVLAEGSTNPAP